MYLWNKFFRECYFQFRGYFFSLLLIPLIFKGLKLLWFLRDLGHVFYVLFSKELRSSPVTINSFMVLTYPPLANLSRKGQIIQGCEWKTVIAFMDILEGAILPISHTAANSFSRINFRECTIYFLCKNINVVRLASVNYSHLQRDKWLCYRNEMQRRNMSLYVLFA